MADANSIAEEARKIFLYDPETGIVTWRFTRGVAKQGMRVSQTRPPHPPPPLLTRCP